MAGDICARAIKNPLWLCAAWPVEKGIGLRVVALIPALFP